jgi:hypothetical protein
VAVVEREVGGDPVPVRDRGGDRAVMVGVAPWDVVAREGEQVRDAYGDRARAQQQQRSLRDADLRL